jgi:hypothetical protein
MIRMAAALGAAFALCAGAARAEDAQTTRDLRCTMVAFYTVSQAKVEAQAGLSGVALYYLGRLDGRTPGLDIEKRIREEAATLTQEQFAAEGKRCGQEMEVRGKEIQVLGANLQKTP